jgi:tRNA (guanine37-N1)-methyltransferase
MKIDIVTLFPQICRAPLSESIMKRAQTNGIVDLRIHNLRDWTTDIHLVAFDAVFFGGVCAGLTFFAALFARRYSELLHNFERGTLAVAGSGTG